MKTGATIAVLMLVLFCHAQKPPIREPNNMPVFRQVSYPFLPVLTSRFYFSDDGLMWFSTAKGLASFDGTEIVYHCNEQESLDYGLNRITCFTERADHDFYLGGNGNLLLYKRKERRFQKIIDSLGVAISFARPQPGGDIIMGLASRGMLVYNPSSKKIKRFNLVAGKPEGWDDHFLNTPICYAENPTDKNKCWIGTFNGIYSLDKRTYELSRNFIVSDSIYDFNGAVIRPPFDVHMIDVANDSIIWFTTWNCGFCSYNTHTGKVELFPLFFYQVKGKLVPASITPSFAKIAEGKYFIGFINKQPVVFDCKTKTTSTVSITGNPGATDKINFCSTDQQGNLWVMRNGLLYISVPRYARLKYLDVGRQSQPSDPSKIADNILSGIYFDSSTQHYYCSIRNAGAVYVLDTAFRIIDMIPIPALSNPMTYKGAPFDKITKDGSGRYWFSGKEIFVLQPGKKQFEFAANAFPQLAWLRTKTTFIDIGNTRNGNIVLQEFGSGDLYLIDHRSLKMDSVIMSKTNKSRLQVYSADFNYTDQFDCVYFANENTICQYSFPEKKLRVISSHSLAGDGNPEAIINFAADTKGRLWVLKGEEGIRIIDPVTLNCIDSFRIGERGLYAGDYNNITGAAKGYMFLQGPHGIVIYNYEKQRSLLFDNNNGLSLPIPRALLYSNGHLVLGQFNRIELYDLADFLKNSFHLKPVLNNITADTTVLYASSFSDGLIKLPHYINSVNLNFSAAEFVFPERIEYAYRLDGIDKDWKYTNYFNRRVNYSNLQPGKYVFKIKAQQVGGNWDVETVEYTIIIATPFWQTWWFLLLCLLIAVAVIVLAIRRRINSVRRQERLKTSYEKELMDLEAKALRAQMNPHFIFNCLNSIKSLIQQHNEEKAITYLTTFSKMIRTLFNNADKKEISLFDEIETCKLYLQLESMRFDTKFSYEIKIAEGLDLKSIDVPALVVQPFIENAIWHGIIPAGSGGHINLEVLKIETDIQVIIDDNGIGRSAAELNRPASSIAHQSKGVKLTQSRILLDNLLRSREVVIETIDKKDDDGNATGTSVIIHFKNQLS